MIDVLLGVSDFDESEYDLMLESFQCSPYGEDTFVKDVKKLLGRQVISIDTRKIILKLGILDTDVNINSTMI